jgi:hypothetical protein
MGLANCTAGLFGAWFTGIVYTSELSQSQPGCSLYSIPLHSWGSSPISGHYGSSIFTAIHSVLSVPCHPTAATAAASKPFQWLTRQFHWLPDGFWH